MENEPLDSTKEHKIYHALSQNNQILSCDRELFLSNLLIGSALIFTTMDLLITSLTLIWCSLVFIILYTMGKKDIKLRHVYIRQIKYKKYYQAQSRLYSRSLKNYKH